MTQRGFTLVELAIVLVIIGLIIGGVLVGRDMIEASRIRSQVSAISEYNAAANTFRAKYGGLPGDLSSVAAARFGFVAGDGTDGKRDGDGIIDCNGGVQTSEVCGETICFWTDLNTANLVRDIGYNAVACPDSVVGNIGALRFWPLARLGRSDQVVFAFGTSGQNYYQIAGLTGNSSSLVGRLASTITPQQAYNIDTKIDDGIPLNGTVQAMGGTSPLGVAAVPAVAAAGVCVTNASGNPYNIANSDYAVTPACQLRFKTSF